MQGEPMSDERLAEIERSLLVLDAWRLEAASHDTVRAMRFASTLRDVTELLAEVRRLKRKELQVSDDDLLAIKLSSGSVRVGPEFRLSVDDLVDEIRRLRRALHLSELSRGVPSVAGGD